MGACALSVGLLVCSSGGAIATADETDTGGTSTESQDDSATADDTDKASSTIPTTKLSSQRDDKDADDDTTTATVTTTVVEAQTNTSEIQQDVSTGITLDTDVVGPEATSVVSTAVVEALAPIVEALTPSTEQVAAPLEPTNTPSEPTDPAESGGAAALAAASASESGSPTATTAAQPTASLQTAVVDPLSNAVTTLARAFGAAGLTLASLTGSQNPITDVITAVQMLLSAVVDAVSEVAKVPGNLLNLLGFADSDGVRPPLFGAGGSIDPVAPVNVPLIGNEAQFPQATIVAVDAPLFGNVVNASNFGGVAPASLSHELALSGLAPAPASVSPATASFLDNVVRSVLVPASLTALAAIAVPGIAGLLIVCAAGIRVGYRQAKAGLALRLSGIARFAGSGPMGVVRSGSLISLHPRTSRVGKPQGTRAGRDTTSSAARHLDQVA